MNRFVPSAGHIAGRPMISAESFTWLGSIFKRSSPTSSRLPTICFSRASTGWSTTEWPTPLPRRVARMAVLRRCRLLQPQRRTLARSARVQRLCRPLPVNSAIRQARQRCASVLSRLRLLASAARQADQLRHRRAAAAQTPVLRHRCTCNRAAMESTTCPTTSTRDGTVPSGQYCHRRSVLSHTCHTAR